MVVVNNQALLAGSSVVASSLTPQTATTSTVPYDNSNHWLGASYTGAGSVSAVATQTLIYDAEQRMIQVSDNTPPASSAAYSFDGDGERVVANFGAVIVTAVYDITRNVVAEYLSGTTA